MTGAKSRDGRADLCDTAVRLGLYANIFLAVLKTATGIVGHSSGLLADGINSTSDVVYYVAVMVFMRLARKPPDEEHPYGHSQFETIGALVVGAFVLTTGVAIFWDSINKGYDLYAHGYAAAEVRAFTLWAAAATVTLKIWLAARTRAIGRATANPAVSALAADHVNDIMAASAAGIGIIFARAGYAWVDPLAGAVVAGFILRTGFGILKDSSMDLMDAVPGGKLDAGIRAVLTGVKGVTAVEEIASHRFGPYYMVNATICVDGGITVSEGDAIATDAERAVLEKMDFVKRVYIHYHPSGPKCGPRRGRRRV
ncbi:MAG: cation diffusion facilitator family transporter [Elusimicrobiales bacterium]|nr:cation diffusion facilitator family transporter [Elusimicrobiales bacterium]